MVRRLASEFRSTHCRPCSSGIRSDTTSVLRARDESRIRADGLILPEAARDRGGTPRTLRRRRKHSERVPDALDDGHQGCKATPAGPFNPVLAPMMVAIGAALPLAPGG